MEEHITEEIRQYLDKQKAVEIWRGTLEELEKMPDRPDWQTNKMEGMKEELRDWEREAKKMYDELSRDQQQIANKEMAKFRREALKKNVDMVVKLGEVTYARHPYQSVDGPGESPRDNRRDENKGADHGRGGAHESGKGSAVGERSPGVRPR